MLRLEYVHARRPIVRTDSMKIGCANCILELPIESNRRMIVTWVRDSIILFFRKRRLLFAFAFWFAGSVRAHKAFSMSNGLTVATNFLSVPPMGGWHTMHLRIYRNEKTILVNLGTGHNTVTHSICCPKKYGLDQSDCWTVNRFELYQQIDEPFSFNK